MDLHRNKKFKTIILVFLGAVKINMDMQIQSTTVKINCIGNNLNMHWYNKF